MSDDIKIDLEFIEFYVKKKYSIRLSDYFEVSKTIITNWRKKMPQARVYEFIVKEGSKNIYELFEKLYPSK